MSICIFTFLKKNLVEREIIHIFVPNFAQAYARVTKKKRLKRDMKKNNQNIFVVLLMSCVMLLAMVQVAIAQPQRTDSLTQSKALTSEPDEMRGRMMTSPLPVTLRQQGRQICVQSRYNQLLPIYTEGGTFYTAFRLSKGTNWITGLPKGTYLINNRKFTIY